MGRGKRSWIRWISYLSAADVGANGTGSPVINTRESNRVLALAPGESVVVADFHKASEIALLSECLGLGLAESECAGVAWQLSLELRSE